MPITQKNRKSHRKVFVLLGKPGSGKNTFTEVLKKLLPSPAFASDTGNCFRSSFRKEVDAAPLNQYHRKRIKAINDGGFLLPASLAIYMWSHYFCLKYTGKERFIIIDGSPRRPDELDPLYSFFSEFYNAKLYFIHLNVSNVTSTARMFERHKTHPREETSTLELIQTRLTEAEDRISGIISAVQYKHKHKIYLIDNEGAPEELTPQAVDFLKEIGVLP